MLLYGTFEENGYAFEAYIPSSDADPVAFELRIIVETEAKFVLFVPMTYVPTFGVDVGDIQFLESVLDRVLRLLPERHDFGADSIVALSKLEAEIGGGAARDQHLHGLSPSSREHGQFEYTTELFAARFADLVGGRESMGLWMKTKLPEFGDHTPEEALRLGMTHEVVEYLLQHADHSLANSSGESESS